MSAGVPLNVVALSVCAAFYVQRATASGLGRALALEVAALGVLGAVAGSQLAAGLANGIESLTHLISGDAGAMSWGAYSGGFLAASARLWFADRTPLLSHFDSAAPGVLAGVAVARIGCFVNGDDFGTVCSHPWCVAFPAGSFAWQLHTQSGWLSPDAAMSLPVHPLQLYLSAAAAAACALVMMIEHSHKMKQGGIALLALLLYSGSRAPLELLRETTNTPPGTQVTGLQLATGILVTAVLITYFSRGTRRPYATGW